VCFCFPWGHVLDFYAGYPEQCIIRVIDTLPVGSEKVHLLCQFFLRLTIANSLRNSGHSNIPGVIAFPKLQTELNIGVSPDLSGFCTSRAGGDPELLIEVY